MKYKIQLQRTLALLILLLAGWAVPGTVPAQAATGNSARASAPARVTAEYAPLVAGQTYRAYFDNSDSRWSQVYVYMWDDETGVELFGSWCGMELKDTEVINGKEYYVLTFTADSDYSSPLIIFNAGLDNEQTDDLQFYDGGVYAAYSGLTDIIESQDPNQVKAPVFSKMSGDFYEDFSLTITDPNEPAGTIYYTLNGTEPSATNGNVYSSPITIPAGMDVTVKAVVVTDNGTSNVTAAKYHFLAKYPLNFKFSNKGGISYVYYSTNSEYGNIQGEKTVYITDGTEVYLEIGVNSGYEFKNVTVNGNVVSTDGYFGFMMPASAADLVINVEYNPASPSDPQPGDTTKKYKLTLVSNPVGSCYLYGGGEYEAGADVRIEANMYNGYEFINWTRDGEEIGTRYYDSFTMPAQDVVLTANFRYNPADPTDPDQPKLLHPLTATAFPPGAGYFYTSATEVPFGDSYYVEAYPNEGYKFKGWLINGVAQEETSYYLHGTMTDAGAQVVGLFVYDPSSPSNPNANYYNPTTGQLIMDDFEPGYLYQAIRNVLNGADKSNVSSIIVKGRMNSNDFSAVRDLSNASTYDLSRVGGVTTVPGYSFQNTSVSSVLLSSAITNLDSYVFNGCTNLTALTVYALEPPVCSSYTFSGFTNKDNCTVFVPKEAIELYSNAEYWKDFTIMPITNDVHVLQVNLPADAVDGRYKHNSLEIVNVNSGIRQKYVVSDRLLYTFNGLQKDEQYNIYMLSQAGLEIGRIENVTIPDHDLEVTFDNMKTLHSVFAKVLDAESNDVTEQTSVEWLKPLADGTITYLRKAVSLGEIPDGQKLICRVTLGDKLGAAYATPEDVEFTVSDTDNTCEISLVPFRTIELTGKVVDGDNAPLAGASISAVQTLNGKFNKTFTAKTDNEGLWKMNVLDAPETRMTYAAIECVNVNETVGAFEEAANTVDLGTKTLRSIVGARVSYGFTYKAAGSEEVLDTYSDYQNVAVSVYNVTQGREHPEVSMQYPVLAVLDENINTGDELRLTATSKTGAFNPIIKTVTIGEDQRAEVTFDIIGKGGISASYEMTENPAVAAMLYGSNGELIKKQAYNEAKTLFSELADGDYTLVTMGQSDLMNSILRLANFAEIGLTEGKDYVKNVVTVETGKLAEVKNSEIPAFDESLFYYTNDNTGFTANKSSITTGAYLTLRSVIDFKGVYKDGVSNVALVVDLPEACDFVEQSVVQGPNLMPYTLDNQRLTIQLGDKYNVQTRFCVIPTKGGEFSASASIVFDYDGRTVTQAIGTAQSMVKDIEIVVPSSTASETFRVSGTARGHATVRVFIDGVMSAETKANGAGNWSTECTLVAPENFSHHTVYAEFISEDSPKLESQSCDIMYNPYEVTVQNVEMTFLNGWNHKQYSVIWNFEDGTVNPRQYDFYTTTDMTFLVRVSYRDLKLIPAVWLKINTSDGSSRLIRTEYNAAQDCWVAVDQFSSNALPTSVAVKVENMMFDMAEDADYNLLINQYVGDIKINGTITNEDGVSITDYIDGNGDTLGEIESSETDETVEEVVDKYVHQGYKEDSNLEDDSDYVPEDDEDVVDSDTKILTKNDGREIVIIKRGKNGRTQIAVIRLICEENEQVSTELVSSTIMGQWRTFYRVYFDEGRCMKVEEYIKHTDHLDEYVNIITSTLVANTIFINPKLVPPGMYIPAKTILATLRRIRFSSKRYTTETMEYVEIPGDCGAGPTEDPEPNSVIIEPILDPSGYVYEAVPENRVEGVQATIYYKEIKENMYGDPYEEIMLWNAEEYAQSNPLFTDENGMYRWDVPQGLWQVKFEKDGYVTAYSEWLPVPPPQLDVNIGITQNKQPEVTEARAYEEGIEVKFDKFMDISTLTTDNIYVTANGEKLLGEIRMVDEALADEYASEEDTEAVRYASRVRFVPEQALSTTTGEVRLTVSRNVLSYAGIPMTETFTQVLDVEKEVQTIYADDVKVLYGGAKEVTVFAVPFDAAAGRTLRIANSSDLIATIDTKEAVLDAEGKAVVTVTGGIPGRTQLSFTIDDVTATGSCAVDVVTEIITAEAPTASRASGTAVYRGTKVELKTDSKDATIWFTTDGSCPCDAEGTRRKYRVPIVINEDTKIIAMTAVGTDERDVSETVEFNYTVKRSDMDLQMAEGWTWISHNFDNPVAASTVFADSNVTRMLSQTAEVIRDPQLGLVGNLTEMTAPESYKVETSAETARQRLSDIAWNPATPISLTAGWNWLGYPAAQTMTVDEALATTECETLDMIVGQNGFAQFDGEKWVGTLETMSPGMGYMYQSQSEKKVVYNTNIVSNASATHAPGIADNSTLAVDIHKYPAIMPVVATLHGTDCSPLDNEEYQVAAFSGTECRGVGRVVEGKVMMNVYGNVNDPITFSVTDAAGETRFETEAALDLDEKGVGDIFDPYVVTINNGSGIADVTYSGDITVTVDNDMLRIRGIAAEDIELVEVYDIDGRKLVRETNVPESGIRVSGLVYGTYVVIVKGNGEYTYHKVAVR